MTDIEFIGEMYDLIGHIIKSNPHKFRGTPHLPKLSLTNKKSISLQAGSGMYSNPREDVPFEWFSAYEMGYPTDVALVKGIERCAEDEDDLLNTVYAYVPKDCIETMLSKYPLNREQLMTDVASRLSVSVLQLNLLNEARKQELEA